MSNAVADLIAGKLGRKFNSHKTGFAFREIRAFPEFGEFSNGTIRNALDYCVKKGILRKVAHPTIKLTGGSAPAIAFVGVDNPRTKDLPEYSLADHPQFKATLAARKENRSKSGPVTITKTKDKAEKTGTRRLSQHARDVYGLIESSEGITSENLYAQCKAVLSLSEANAIYHVRASIKRGDVMEFGPRGKRTYYTKKYYDEQAKLHAQQQHEIEAVNQAVEAHAAQATQAQPQAINGHANGHAVQTQAFAAPVSNDAILSHLRGLAGALADQLSNFLVERMTANLSQIVGALDVTPINPQAIKAQVESVVSTPREKKRKIAIIGLNPATAGIIQTEWGERFNLEFVGPNETSKVDGAIGHADEVIGMVNFMSHSIDGHAKQHQKYTRISGGLTQLRQKLQNFAQQSAH